MSIFIVGSWTSRLVIYDAQRLVERRARHRMDSDTITGISHHADSRPLELKLALAYSDRANRRPSSTDASNAGATLPTRSVRKLLSMVIICETLTTDGFDRPVPRTGSRTLPGASARRRFEVITAAMTVLIRLSLKLFAETTRYGLRYPGPEPEGSGNDAHQTSPRRATISRA